MFYKQVSPESLFLKEVGTGRRKTESYAVYGTKSSLLFKFSCIRVQFDLIIKSQISKIQLVVYY